YAYLQKGETDSALNQWAYLKTITNVQPANFKVAYAFASVPSRFVLENKLWKEAAVLETHSSNVDWKVFPWQRAILHFTRLMGAVHIGAIEAAQSEWKKLDSLRKNLLMQKDTYKANQVAIQMKTGEAWIQFKEGKSEEALILMHAAAAMEDKTEKHPVT
ncbi:hypothetical protein QUS89_22610, partial [Xanthomonas citri pv. citri]